MTPPAWRLATIGPPPLRPLAGFDGSNLNSVSQYFTRSSHSRSRASSLPALAAASSLWPAT